MDFRTELKVTPLGTAIDHAKRGLFMGSCFSDNIAQKMRRYRFRVCANPFGVLYNPASLAEGIRLLEKGEPFTGNDISEADGVWFSYRHHSSFSSTDAPLTLNRINASLGEGAASLAEADYVVITFGSALIYELEGRVVANCHKQPARLFTRRMLTPHEAVSLFEPIMEGSLREKQVIFTLSPVRHLGEGFEANSLSKSVLRVAIEMLVSRYRNARYFPAFEIVNDDLRDYRFYGRDMAHPSEEAIEYVWQKFAQATVTAQSRELMERIEGLVRATEHRPFNSDSSSHRAFMLSMLEKAERLHRESPEADICDIVEFFREGVR